MDSESISNQAILFIGTITAVVVAIYAGNWQADLLAQTQGGNDVYTPICPAILCASPPRGCKYVAPFEDDSGCRGCGALECEEICPIVECASPPEGCNYVPPYKKDNKGCQIGCGVMNCSGQCPLYDCPVVPDGCRGEKQYDNNGCQRCAKVICDTKPIAPKVCTVDEGVYQVGDTFKAPDGCSKCYCNQDGSVECTDRVCPTDQDDDSQEEGLYRYAKWKCQNGKIVREGGLTSCKSRKTWKNYAYQACPNGIVDLETYESCKDDDNRPNPVLCLGQYKPGESFKAPDGCNQCICSPNGQSACTKMFCPDKEPSPQPPRSQSNPNDPNDPDQGCYSSQDCGQGTVCSVDFGDCSVLPSDPSLDVCVGFCMPKKLAYPQLLPECDFSQDCPLGQACTKDFGDDCLDECPLNDNICAVMCDGRCIPQDFDEQPDERWEDEWDDAYEPDDYDQWDDHQEPEYEEEVRTAPIVSRFTDTEVGTLESTAADALAAKGVIGGFPDGTFRGNDPVNRAGAAKFLLLARYGIVSEASNDSLFIDLLRGEWYVKYVVRAAELGIISGYSDRTFRPANTVNTAEFLKMLSKAFDLPQDLPHNYSDVPEGAWFAKYAGVADVYELLPGRPQGELQPDRLLSRGEVAIAIYKLLENQ